MMSPTLAFASRAPHLTSHLNLKSSLHLQQQIFSKNTRLPPQFKLTRYTRPPSSLAVTSASNSQASNENSGNGGGGGGTPGPQFGLRQIKGDGRCMFRALAQGSHYCTLLDSQKPPSFLSPDEETQAADALRNTICDALLHRKDHFSLFIDSDESRGGSFENYVENMRRERTFGGEPELAAAADVLKRPISIFQVDPLKQEIALVSEYTCSSESVEKPGDWPIPLVYHAAGPQSGHYDLLAPVDISEE